MSVLSIGSEAVAVAQGAIDSVDHALSAPLEQVGLIASATESPKSQVSFLGGVAAVLAVKLFN